MSLLGNLKQIPNIQEDSFLLSRHIRMEDAFDSIISNSLTNDFHHAIEEALKNYFSAEKVSFFDNIQSIKILYCLSSGVYCSHETGIIGFALSSRKILNLAQASDHNSYSIETDKNIVSPDQPILLFPISDSESNVKGIVSISRTKTTGHFSEDDIKSAEYFQKKFKIYSQYLFQPQFDMDFVTDLLKISHQGPYIQEITSKLINLFNCENAELWRLNSQTGQMTFYSAESNSEVNVPTAEASIASAVFKSGSPFSLISKEKSDTSILGIPVRDAASPFFYSVILKNKRSPHFFSANDENRLSFLLPYITSFLAFSEKPSKLREIIEIFNTIIKEQHMAKLIKLIVQELCKLFNADRCLFYSADNQKELLRMLTFDCEHPIEIPFKCQSVACLTFSTREVVNIENAYLDKRFNKCIDVETGYKTCSLLSVPLIDQYDIVKGVIQLINKAECPFTKEDEEILKLVAPFVQSAFDYSELYQATIEVSYYSRLTHEFTDAVYLNDQLDKCVFDILKSFRAILKTVVIEVFVIKNGSIDFTPLASVFDQSVDENEAREAALNNYERRMLFNAASQLKSRCVIKRVGGDDDYKKFCMCAPLLSCTKERNFLGFSLVQWKKNGNAFSFDDVKAFEMMSNLVSIPIQLPIFKNSLK